MANVNVRLEVNPDAITSEGESTGEKIKDIVIDNPAKLNKVSIKSNNNGVLNPQTDKEFIGTEMLSMAKGYLSFNDEGFLTNDKNGNAGQLQSINTPRSYVFGAVNANGEYELTLTLNMINSGSHIDHIVIVGDQVSNQFPIEAFIDDNPTSIYSDDFNWVIKFPNTKATHTIRFTKWNRPSYNATLLQIRVMYRYLDLGNDSLEKLNSLSQSMSNPSKLLYEILANSGNVSIVDGFGEFEDLIKDGIIPNDSLNVELFINGNKVQDHITSDSSYESGERILSFGLSNKITKMAKTNFLTDESEKFITRPFFSVKSNTKNISRTKYSDNASKITYRFTGEAEITLYGVAITESFDNNTGGYKFTISNQLDFSENIDSVKIYPSSAFSRSVDLENHTRTIITTSNATIEIETNLGNYTGNLDDLGYIDASNGINIDFGRNKVVSLYYIANRALSQIYTPEEINYMFSRSVLIPHAEEGTIPPETTPIKVSIKRYLNEIMVACVQLKQLTILSVLNYICDVAQICGYEDDDGKLIFESARPVFNGYDKTIEIPNKYIFEDLKYSLVNNNKYNKVDMGFYTMNKSEKSIVHSDTIYALNSDFDYIGNDLGTNNTNYTISYIEDTGSNVTDIIQTVKFSLDLKNVLENFDTKNICDFKLKINKSVANMSFGRQLIEQNGSNVWHEGELYNGDAEVSEVVKNPKDAVPYSHIKTLYSIDENAIMNIEISQIVKRTYSYLISSDKSFINYQNIYSFDVEVVANCYDFTANNITKNNAENVATIAINPLMVSQINYENRVNNYLGTYAWLENMLTLMADVKESFILLDYKDGISTGTITVACGDLFYRDGSIAKNWGNGEILQVGEIIFLKNDLYLNGSQRFWKITGRNVIYDSVPTLKLEVMECKHTYIF